MRRVLFQMNLHLPSHISFGLFGRRAVLLDLKADRYWLIDPATSATLSVLSRGNRSAATAEALDNLKRRGLIADGDGPPIEPVETSPVEASALEALARDGRISLGEVALFRWHAGTMLRRRGLAATIAYWRRLRAASAASSFAPDDEGEAAATRAAHVARGFEKSRLFLPLRRLCVPDSLALARSLWRRGLDADVYFGVRMPPFAAHAWVQSGTLLLSDPVGIVADYRPVFRL